MSDGGIMREFVITTDNMADLPDEYVEQNNIGLLSLSYLMEGVTYDKFHDLPYKEFYDKMRKGSMPITSQINPEVAKGTFGAYVDEGYDVLHIAFSSGLSGSYNSAKVAALELEEENPGCRVVVIDSLLASLGQGLMVDKMVQMKKAGKSLDELAKWAADNISHVCSYFTVDDLFHLFRGGRVSRATAFIGSIANIKPILYIDREGKLINIGKIRGRKKSLVTLVDYMEKKMGSYRDKNDTIFISHGDCIEDAEYVKKMIKERLGFEVFIISHVGPTIGSHSGPGTLALFFMGEEK